MFSISLAPWWSVENIIFAFGFAFFATKIHYLSTFDDSHTAIEANQQMQFCLLRVYDFISFHRTFVFIDLL